MKSRCLSLFVLLCGLMRADFVSGAEPAKDGDWKPLFNGKDFSGWYIISTGKKNEDPKHLFQVHDGVIHMYKDAEQGSKQPSGYIATEKEYSHYHLRFQYKWGTKRFAPRTNVKRDAGLMYHMVGPDVVWPKSMECQVQEGDVGDIFTVNVRFTATVDPATTNLTANIVTNATTHVIRTNMSCMPVFKEAADGGVPYVQGVAGGIRRVVRSKNYEVDGWNTVEVIVRGDSAVHIVNGKVNNRLDHMQQMVNKEWVPLDRGKIVFQQEFAEVLYRNIEIKELKE
ncbi:MAG: hypothetical protein JWQ71_4809 [Pedosphaera sp.]|nr:hypothetical protein [Pedosphaera sp.]